MFLNLPNTPEVYKAKNELWQMMEDKSAQRSICSSPEKDRTAGRKGKKKYA